MKNDIMTNEPKNDVDLLDLIQDIWAAKLLVFAITVAITCIAAAYAFFSTPVYQASVQILPPTSSGLSAYNIGSQLTGAAISGITTGLVINGNTQVAVPAGIKELSPKEAYNSFTRRLASETIRQQFFKQFYLPAHRTQGINASEEHLWKQLSSELKVTVPTKPIDIESKVTIEGPDPKTITDWANAYVALAIRASQNELMDDLSGEIQVRSESIEEQIATVRNVARIARRSRIEQLKSAIKIAEAVNLEDPSSDLGWRTGNDSARFSRAYLLGAKALRAELSILEKRENDDPFIPELPDLLKKQALLTSINLNPTKLAVAIIDRPATTPENPIKPKKALALVLGAILGGILGIFVCLVHRKLKKHNGE